MLWVIVLSGCSTSGLDAQKSFSCKAPPGIGCSSLSGVYANAVANNLPGSNTVKPTSVYSKLAIGSDKIIGHAPAVGMPVLSEPSVLRVWVAPWEDDHKVLHDQEFLYAVADPGHWQIAHTQQKIADQYRVFAPTAKPLPSAEPVTGQAPYQVPQVTQQKVLQGN
jgi:conjugal transfer pilus assembly protein TraV